MTVREVNTKIPACFHAGDEQWAHFQRSNPLGESGKVDDPIGEDPALAEFMIATMKVHDLAEAALSKKSDIMGNPMNTEAKNMSIALRIAKQHHGSAMAAVQAAINDAVQHIAKWEKEILPEAPHPAIASDIRRALLSMDVKTRREFLDGADDALAGSVLHSHYAAVGMTKEEFEGFRTAFIARTRPEKYARIKRADKALAQFKATVVNSADRFFTDLVDAGAVRDAVAREEKARAAQVA